ncbi:hypothetical protein QQX98_007045 [Neonectria punicea]|uniref:RING-type domain-containing protein n=1 Tax=Neonectria punicea TaxID=979145 RepID=A0ABR1GZ51_9HYPO
MSRPAGTTLPFRDGAEVEDFTRTIAGAFVRSEDGGRVSNVCLPSDFSAVHVSGLPQDSSPKSIHAFLAQHGFRTAEKYIWVMREGGVVSAKVQSEDPAFSKKLGTLVQTGLLWGTSRIQATPVAARMPSGHTSGRVDCKKVHVSWHKAVRTAWLNFGNGDVASRVSRKFATGIYKILGQKVTAGTPSQSSGVRRSYNPINWTVTLTDVPVSTSTSEITRAIFSKTDKPRHIELGAPSYSIDEEQASAVVRSLLTKIGPVEYWETTLESTAKRIKATARFLDEMGARDAVSQLNGTMLPFHKNGKLTVQMVYSAKFKVRSDIYTAVASRAGAHVDQWKAKHVSFRSYPGYRMLKVEGESATEVASAKAMLDGIVGGVVVKNGQGSLWDDSLKRNGQLWQAIKHRQRELGVVIVRDRIKQELRLFGTKVACDKAQRHLASLFCMETSSAHVIELDSTKFRWACRGGFETISGRLGTEKAALYVVPSPRIVITGSLEDFDIALALVNGQEVAGETESKSTLGGAILEDCSICWTETDTPVRIACGHAYCPDCFENSCASLPGTGADFVLLCHGDQGKCLQEIGLQDLHKHLSSPVLEAFLEQSFLSLFRRTPNKLRFCPTPDCGYVYRVTESARTHTCSNCLQPTCSACYEPHVDMTCAEYKDIRSGGYAAFEKLKKEAGFKDCPKCKTPIEKTEGCNHITCMGCKTHMCWVCMMTFPEGRLVYEHMGQMHGGHVEWDG